MTARGENRVLIDTSVAIPYLVETHAAHRGVRASLLGDHLVLSAHSLAETYSVLTRLPGEARLRPLDAARLIDANFDETALMRSTDHGVIHRILSEADIYGGAVYDALVALAAVANGLTLATRDARALGTYSHLGAAVRVMES